MKMNDKHDGKGDVEMIVMTNEDHDDVVFVDKEHIKHAAFSKFEVRQRVIARDEDGIMYYAIIRRKMYGINHQQQLSCLKIFDSYPLGYENERSTGSPMNKNGQLEEMGNDKKAKNENNDHPEWSFFVHFEGWKSLWDRWVSEADVMEATSVNEERMKAIGQAHRALQQEFKGKSKKRKVQKAGMFMQLWKQRLDGLSQEWEKQDQKGRCNIVPAIEPKTKVESMTKTKNNNKSQQDLVQDQALLAMQSCLTNRSQAHIQAIPLAFGLKRILVEDWEILNASNRNEDEVLGNDDASHKNDKSMVHVLPAKVTVRNALSLYLQEKGITWNDRSIVVRSPNNMKEDEMENASYACYTPDSSSSFLNVDRCVITKVTLPSTSSGDAENAKENLSDDPASTMDNDAETSSGNAPIANEQSCKVVTSNQGDIVDTTSPTRELPVDHLTKEWTDMADGISLYFEQALKLRLLYPSEISQLTLLEESMSETSELEKVDIYGCEHLLRLISIMPRILDQHFRDATKKRREGKRKRDITTDTLTDAQEQYDDEESFAEMDGVVLAKLQDLARFLQKNQSTLFCSHYRKKNEAEVKLDGKIQRRQERRLKSKFVSLVHQTSPQHQLNDVKSDIAINEDIVSNTI
jgi:hypothetical protein